MMHDSGHKKTGNDPHHRNGPYGIPGSASEADEHHGENDQLKQANRDVLNIECNDRCRARSTFCRNWVRKTKGNESSEISKRSNSTSPSTIPWQVTGRGKQDKA